MNYRHHFHAGNFADVMKHVLMLQLLRGLQRKERGLLLLDTHAGRGTYDLEIETQGDSRERKPEYPDGIGRLPFDQPYPAPLEEYLSQIKEFDRQRGNAEPTARFYPGSPWLLRALARPQDRLAFCEKHPEEYTVLKNGFTWDRRVTAHELDGYIAIRALLPPPEKRALVLIDPPFEEKDEFARVIVGLRDGLQRLPGGTFAVWYPLTERARADVFLHELTALKPPPSFAVELTIAGDTVPIKMKGCGLAVVNPPWQVDRIITPLLPFLADRLAQTPGGSGQLRWLVPES